MNITIQLANPDDAPDMAEIHARSWEAAYKDFIPMEYIREASAKRPDLWKRIVTNENTTHYIIKADGKTVGIMTIAPPKDEDVDDNYFELHGIYLHPDYFYKGIGTQAVNFAFDKALELGKKFMNVWVFAENENAIKFYEKHGFTADNKTNTHDHVSRITKSIRMKKILLP